MIYISLHIIRYGTYMLDKVKVNQLMLLSVHIPLVCVFVFHIKNVVSVSLIADQTKRYAG